MEAGPDRPIARSTRVVKPRSAAQVDGPDAMQESLITEAKHAAGNAYVPYSHFPVGAALLTAEGKIVTGCNVENASYGLTICAERTAIFRAIASKTTRALEIVALAVIQGDGLPASPCGACRQVIFEHGADAVVLFSNGQDIITHSIAELLPEAFNLPPEN